ncbi:hypothetical protein TNCV_1935131 [Trichonephila clavipes]|nr:hypothetical protein TNCV_1935131 [Trichonephila clavipes]
MAVRNTMIGFHLRAGTSSVIRGVRKNHPNPNKWRDSPWEPLDQRSDGPGPQEVLRHPRESYFPTYDLCCERSAKKGIFPSPIKEQQNYVTAECSVLSRFFTYLFLNWDRVMACVCARDN